MIEITNYYRINLINKINSNLLTNHFYLFIYIRLMLINIIKNTKLFEIR